MTAFDEPRNSLGSMCNPEGATLAVANLDSGDPKTLPILGQRFLSILALVHWRRRSDHVLAATESLNKRGLSAPAETQAPPRFALIANRLVARD